MKIGEMRDVTMNGMTRNRAVAIGILDFVEEMLEEKNITIPDDDRTGSEDEARLYGCTYGNLEDEIVAFLDQVYNRKDKEEE